MKVKKIDVTLLLVCLALFKMEALPIMAKNGIQILSLIGAFCILGINYKIRINDISFIIIIPIVISSVISYLSGIISIQNVFNCFFYMMALFEFSNIVWIYSKDNSLEMFKTMKQIFAIFFIMNLISIFIIGTEDTGNTTYLFGGKFISVYLAFFSILLSFSTKEEEVGLPKLLVSCGLLSLFSIYFSCSTGIILAMALFLSLIIPTYIKKFLCNGKTVLIIVILTALLVFSIESIINIPLISNFITGTLNRNLTLSGRLPIYKYYLIPLILKKPILGYGYGSSILHVTTPYWNAQNGLLDYQLNYGICGSCSILLLFWLVARSYKNKFWYMYSFMFLLIVAGIWESSYGLFLYTVLILIYNLNRGTPNDVFD